MKCPQKVYEHLKIIRFCVQQTELRKSFFIYIKTIFKTTPRKTPVILFNNFSFTKQNMIVRRL